MKGVSVTGTVGRDFVRDCAARKMGGEQDAYVIPGIIQVTVAGQFIFHGFPRFD